MFYISSISVWTSIDFLIEILQGAHLNSNGFPYHRFSQDSLTFSAILRVSGIGRSMAKTIVTMYMIKHCRECFKRYKARGCMPSGLFSVKHEQGNAFTILKNFQRKASI